ncbi:hypothetical protein AWC29_05095 [Mycobacterium triplex]|uniref:Transposase n=1 Tax=Mycobacterium triplex TaxID=47839 RepID=A0A024JUM7_9MYCO|nr:hypothetical protein [Mycobacterium triplex]ORX08219.1 hypothetical protein AWC29_05095 [Mycobacterium triplex]CDO87264.1 transposase [Mycobacterium triplex]
MTYCYFDEPPRLEDIEPATHTEVLVAGSRLDQGRMRAAIDAVFAAHPDLGTVFESKLKIWMTRPGGGWAWGVEPPGGTVTDVVARHLASFDMHTGRLFAASLLPGDPDRVVLTASRLCIDEQAWLLVVGDVVLEYNAGTLSAKTSARA